MTEDIVSQLRRVPDSILRFSGPEPNPYYYRCQAAADEIERLRTCLQHAIDHVGKWQLFTAEEKQSLIAEYEQAVRGE